MAGVLVTAVSLVWVLWLLRSVWPELEAHSADIRIAPLLAGASLSLVSAYLTFEAFVALVRILRISGLPRRELAHLHFTAQLLKHLPGRVWGLGYQWTYGKSAGSLGDWVLVNMGHMVLAIFFAAWAAWFALAIGRGMEWALFAAIGGGSAYAAGWALVSSRRIARWMRWLPGRPGDLARATMVLLAATPRPARVGILLIFAASWTFHYAAWAFFGLSYPPLGASDGAQLCAYYMLAWLAGYVSLLTPSGLGVRELVFAWLAKDFPGDAVAMMAVVGRISLLSVDVIMGVVFAPFVPRRS